mgnify:CR=1 FL=1
MPLVVVDGHPDRPILAQQLPQHLQTRQHHAQPLAVLQVVVVVLERALGVVGRVNENALHAPTVERQQGLERRYAAVLGTHLGRAEADIQLAQAAALQAALVAKGLSPRPLAVAGAYEREAIRLHVFGRFEDLLVAAESHPAMLVYLDQAKRRRFFRLWRAALGLE